MRPHEFNVGLADGRHSSFGALSDVTRRAVVERLRQGPASVKELAQPFDMALPSFVQHLKILEDAGLIGSRKEGRVRTCYLQQARFSEIEQWVLGMQKYWEDRVDALANYAEARHQARDKVGDEK